MKSVRFFDRRAGYSLGAIGLLLGMVLPGVFPAFASAANLTSRSITLSNSSAGAASVSYELKATTTAAMTNPAIRAADPRLSTSDNIYRYLDR